MFVYGPKGSCIKVSNFECFDLLGRVLLFSSWLVMNSRFVNEFESASHSLSTQNSLFVRSAQSGIWVVGLGRLAFIVIFLCFGNVQFRFS